MRLNALRAKLATKPGLTIVGGRQGPTIVCDRCQAVTFQAGPQVQYERCQGCKAKA